MLEVAGEEQYLNHFEFGRPLVMRKTFPVVEQRGGQIEIVLMSVSPSYLPPSMKGLIVGSKYLAGDVLLVGPKLDQLHLVLPVEFVSLAVIDVPSSWQLSSTRCKWSNAGSTLWSNEASSITLDTESLNAGVSYRERLMWIVSILANP